MRDTLDICVKGNASSEADWQLDGIMIKQQGRFIRIGEIFDEYWLERDKLPNPGKIVDSLLKNRRKPDIFTFSQKVPDADPLYNYFFKWDNIAVLEILSYEHWYKNQIPSATKRNIRNSEKRGVVTRVVKFDEKYTKGIMSIYNESPYRHGKRFWHYGKDFDTVQRENMTYEGRSTFLAAYFKEEMIGYLKIVWDNNIGAIMQILSKMKYFNLRPNNALIAEAVRQCEFHKTRYLLYNKYDYLKKVDDSLTKFKKANGFVRMNIPKYYIPLTRRGSVALRFGLYRTVMEMMPDRIVAPLRNLREKWYKRKIARLEE